MPRQPIIFAAMHTEAKAIRKGLGREAPIHVIGIGGKSIPSPAELAMADAIILAGFAGALDPTLKVGDLVLDTDLELPNLPFRRGRIHGSNKLIASSSEKTVLFRATGAIAVDMETLAVQSLGRQMGLPFIGLRAITDTAEDALDPALLRFTNSFGGVKPLSLATTLARQPSLVPTLLHLGRCAKIAGRSLSEGMPQLWAALLPVLAEISSRSPSPVP
jgi:adenosylhomocysteine nucleosidase